MLKVISLSLLTKDIPERFDITQYSIEPQIGFNITDVKIESNVTARIYAEKPSGFKVYSTCTISNNIIKFTPTTQMFAEVGITKMQLQLTVSGNLLYSFLIHANVTPNIIDDSAVESQDDFSALQQAISTLGQYDGRLQTLEDHTVKDNENGSINGKLSITGLFTTENGIESKGSFLRISNLGDTSNAFETLYFKNTYGTVSYIRSYDGDENGSAMCIRPGGALFIGSGEYATNRYGLGDVLPTTEQAYFGSDGAIFFETNANSIENRKTIIITTGGSIQTNQQFKIYSPDRANNVNKSDNRFMLIGIGNSLNIGSDNMRNGYRHTGTTYLSSGVRPEPLGDSTRFDNEGYPTAYISVPTAVTRAEGEPPYVTEANTYEIFHSGHLNVSKATAGTLPTTRGGTGSTGYGVETYNLNGSTAIIDKSIASSANSGDWKNIGSFTIADVGVYLFRIHCRFATNANGWRSICLSDASASAPFANTFWANKMAVNGLLTEVSLVCFLKVTTANTTYYINGMQNSGSALNVSTRLSAIRLK